MAKQFTLGKNERLKSRRAIEELFTQGKKIDAGIIRALFLIKDDVATGHLSFGAGLKTSVFKKAVDRNRIKRLIRESWRLQKNPLQEILAEKNKHVNVFVIYQGKTIPAYSEVFAVITTIMDKLKKKIELA